MFIYQRVTIEYLPFPITSHGFLQLSQRFAPRRKRQAVEGHHVPDATDAAQKGHGQVPGQQGNLSRWMGGIFLVAEEGFIWF